MFSRIFNNNLTISLILLGFCIYIIKLFFTDDINLYIHPRYSVFALVMSSLGAVIVLIAIALDLLNRYKSSRLLKKSAKTKHQHIKKPLTAAGLGVNIVTVVVLVLAFALPPQTLSPEAVERRTLKTSADIMSSTQASTGIGESYAASDKQKTCPKATPKTLDAWVYNIAKYPFYCYEGETISLTGFVFESGASKPPTGTFYLGRVVMSCCAIDAQPYALPILSNGKAYQKDSWWTVEGVLKKMDFNGVSRIVVEPRSIKSVSEPHNPYQYINL